MIGLVALVFAVVTSNELVAWVCIGASVLGVVLLIIDALRERQRRDVVGEAPDADEAEDAGDKDARSTTPKRSPTRANSPAAEDATVEASDDRAK